MLTAAHCVFDINDSLQYVSALDFMPGLNGGTAPYGTIEWKSVRVLSTFTSQVQPCGLPVAQPPASANHAWSCNALFGPSMWAQVQACPLLF